MTVRLLAKPFNKVWWSLHEPRVVTFISICVYTAAIIIGFSMVNATLPLTFDTPYRRVAEGYLLMLSGGLGIPCAWRGLWYLERVACFGLAGVGMLVMLSGLADLFGFFDATEHPVTASWLMGVFCWIAFGWARWFRVKEQPYAPGRGPLPLHVQEKLALQLLKDISTYRAAQQGRDESD